MAKNFYTIEEANNFIPALKKIVPALRRTKEEIDKCHDFLLMSELIERDVAKDEQFRRIVDRMESLLCSLKKQLDDLKSKGCIIRNFDDGIVDLCCKREDSAVFLSWKEGEEEVQYWHTRDDNVYRQRRICDL